MKIAIMGYSGSGKSTLCRELSEICRLPSLHLDSVYFLPGWQERSGDEMTETVRTFLEKHPDGWVIDGNYSKLLFSERVESADVIILMLFHRVNCFFRCLKRFLVYHGKSRPDMTEGCNEKFDGAFIRWILWEGRSERIRERYETLQRTYPQKVVVLKNQRQLDAYLKTFRG